MSSSQQLLLGEGAGGGIPNYIEEVFSTYLYTSTGGDITITNNIDLSTKGGLVWIKSRSNAFSHYLTDTVRGAGRVLYSDLVNGQSGPGGGGASSFSTTGYVDGNQNASPITQVSWTFRKQPKFFDVVTYTGDGLPSNIIPHNLGSVPGFIICKRTNSTSGWAIWHRGNGTTSYGLFALNSTAAATANFSAAPTSTTFDAYNIWDTGNPANASGGTYVAYLFAHNAGGFGLTGTDNVISCGSYTGNGSTQQDITLGYEPQWLMIKRTDTTNSWIMVDVMRGLYQTADAALEANSSNAEAAGVSMTGAMQPIATGFHLYNANSAVNASGGTYIYVAIRRGPMKVPTTGTSVFSPNLSVATTGQQITTNFPVDSQWFKYRPSAGNTYVFDRLRGVSTTTTESGRVLYTNRTDAEANDASTRFFNNTGFQQNSGLTDVNNYIFWNFGRAPSFFDEVCYTGTGVARTVTHNLAAVPELMIVKSRSRSPSAWYVYNQASGNTKELFLNTTDAAAVNNTWNNTTPTSSVFSIDSSPGVNDSGATYVAYLFATCAGVSKVGSYTGTGTTLQINCGFTAGARFVLIKRTDSTGDWYVWDSARGIIAGNDPYLLLNSTAAEVTGTDYVDTYSAGFEISSTAPAAINASAGTFIFLAIA